VEVAMDTAGGGWTVGGKGAIVLTAADADTAV
jgi:hypothetical protein